MNLGPARLDFKYGQISCTSTSIWISSLNEQFNRLNEKQTEDMIESKTWNLNCHGLLDQV